MSVKNKAKDRDANGRIKRRYTGPNNPWPPASPSKGWRQLYMNRPKRRLNTRLCWLIVLGVEPDTLAFPVGSRKPHEYEW